MPVEHGSVTLSAAAIATHASTHVPPERRIDRPIEVANGWLVEAIPERLWIDERREVKGREGEEGK